MTPGSALPGTIEVASPQELHGPSCRHMLPWLRYLRLQYGNGCQERWEASSPTHLSRVPCDDEVIVSKVLRSPPLRLRCRACCCSLAICSSDHLHITGAAAVAIKDYDVAVRTGTVLPWTRSGDPTSAINAWPLWLRLNIFVTITRQVHYAC